MAVRIQEHIKGFIRKIIGQSLYAHLILIKRRLKRIVNHFRGLDLWFPVQIRCRKEYHGDWCLCANNITKDSIIYSFGLGEDVSFDLSLIAKFDVPVYGFDPTPRAIQWLGAQELPKDFVVLDYGIAGYDGTAAFSPPNDPSNYSYTLLDRSGTGDSKVEGKVYRIGTIMEMLGHKKIDILKLDIEGAEYDVIDDMLACGIDVGQLLVEFHHRFAQVGLPKTKHAITSLRENGYKVFYSSASGSEYGFIRS